MKKVIYLLMVLAIFVSCNKNPKENAFRFQALSFGTTIRQLDGTKAFVFPTNEVILVTEASSDKNKKVATLESVTQDHSMTPMKPEPSLNEILLGKWEFSDRLFSLSQALRAGIPMANISSSRSLKLFVREYSRKTPRLAIDGITTLYYGQTIRSVIEIDNYDASIGIDLPSIAANGTLQKGTQHFYFYKDGFYNPKIDQIISDVSGKVFNVENYSTYQETMTRMIALLADPQTQLTVAIIDIVTKTEDDRFLMEAPIIAYTLSRISSGESCDRIKAKFLANEDALYTINKIYSALNMECGVEKPSSEIGKKAKKYLQGITIW
jgi:hypothetical protein